MIDLLPPVRIIIPAARLGIDERKGMTEDEFQQHWRLMRSPAGTGVWEEKQLPHHISSNRIWSWVDTGDGRKALVAGRSNTHVIGYAITMTPWITGHEVVMLEKKEKKA